MSGAVPELRFPEFTQPIRPVRLGDVATFSKGKGVSKSDIDPNGSLPCIRYGELYTVYGTIIDIPVSRTNVPAKGLNLSQGGEILVPASGETSKDIATAAVVKRSGVAIGGDLNIIRSDHDGAYLASYLSGRKRMDLAAMAQGNSVVHLYAAQLGSLEVYLPDIAEERKISKFLTHIDVKLTALREKADALCQFKTGLMQKLFSQELRFTREDGSDFPEWDFKTLGDLLDYEQPGKYIVSSNQYHDNGTPVLTAGKTFILGHTSEKEGIFNPIRPTIIFDDFTTSSHLVDFSFKVKSSAMKILHVKRLSDQPIWVFECIRALDFKPQAHQRHWISLFQDMEVPVPSPEEQKKIVDALSALSSKIDAVTDQITHMETFKKGLLQKMFV